AHFRTVRIVTQTKNATMPARNRPKARVSIPVTVRPSLPQEREQPAEHVVERVGGEEDQVEHGQPQDQPHGGHAGAPVSDRLVDGRRPWADGVTAPAPGPVRPST